MHFLVKLYREFFKIKASTPDRMVIAHLENKVIYAAVYWFKGKHLIFVKWR